MNKRRMPPTEEQAAEERAIFQQFVDVVGLRVDREPTVKGAGYALRAV